MSTKRILIVDDDAGALDVLEMKFRSNLDCDIDLAANGLDAYLLAERKTYDLICTDYRMPLMNGGDLIRAIRTRSKLNNATPIFFFTGFRSEVENDLVDFDALNIFEKPVKFDEVFSAIDRFV